MPDSEQKLYRHWSTQIEAADADRIEAAAKAVGESRSGFVRKAALARAAEVEAKAAQYVIIREMQRGTPDKD